MITRILKLCCIYSLHIIYNTYFSHAGQNEDTMIGEVGGGGDLDEKGAQMNSQFNFPLS